MLQRTELARASTFAASLYPSTMTRGITQAVVSTSYFQGNNNFLSSRAGSSSSSRSLGGGFNGFNNNNHNFDLFDSMHHRIDDIFGHSTINVQQYARILPGGRVSRFFAPSIVPRWSNSFIPQQSQPPSNTSTSSYRLNPHPPPPGQAPSVDVEFNQYMHMGASIDRSGNLHLGNNHILTSTSSELRAQRDMLRDEVFSHNFLIYFF